MAQRGYSSVGRAPPLHGGCQRFDSAYLHNEKKFKYFVTSLIISNGFCVKFKELRVYGEYLGIQKRRRTWLPTIRFGELETSYDPEVSE
jgi:hypothetical protein